MRILQIITLCELGGAQSVVVNLANKLSETNEVIVASGDGDGKMWAMLNSNVKKVHCKHLKRDLSPMNDFLTLVDFRKLYWKYKPDIIHLHSSKAGMLGRIVFPSEKIVYTVHGFDSIRLAYRKYLLIERFMQRFCKAIVGVSNYDKQNLLSERITTNVGVVYNGIECPKKLNSDPFVDFSKYSKKVLVVARLSPQKNVNLFLEVAERLSNYAFIWVGNQQEFCGRYPENVFFMGSLLNAGAYNEYADLFMLPSNYEGLPMTIIEAMAFGKPVVASNVGGISEIVENDVNGYVVENTPESFAEKIKYILENRDVYQLFSRHSLERFNRYLTIDKMVESYLKIYNS